MNYELNRVETFGFEAEWQPDHGHDVLVVTEPGGGFVVRQIDNIFNQAGWLFWMQHTPDLWDQPEAHRDTWAKNDPRRVRSGQKAAMWFTFFRRHHAGILREISVLPGQRVTLSFYAHAWSNGLAAHLDDPYWSDGAGREVVDWLESDVVPRDTGDPEHDARGNIVLRAGIDPHGGWYPLDSGIIWSPGRCIYNGYSQQPITVSCIVPAGVTEITVLLESTVYYKFKHNDIYVDDVTVTIEDPVGQHVEAGSKLGLHILRNGPGVAEFLAAGPAVALFDTDLGLSASAPAATLCIGKIAHSSFDAQSLYSEGMTPGAAARLLVERDRARYEDHPRITHWVGFNEPVWTTAEQMTWYAQLEIERIRALQALGLRAVIGEFATGTPELDQWGDFLAALRYGADHDALLGLHEYSCPWMWWMAGEHQLHAGEDQGREGWTTLRYRKVKRLVLEPNRIEIPIVITECGIDPMVNPKPPGAPARPWTGLADYWREHDGEDNAAAYYVQQLIWYDDELRQDDYVRGAAIFCGGNYGGTWAHFDIAGTPVIEGLRQLVAGPGGPPMPPEPPEPPEPPIAPTGRGAPREQYERTYVLLPPQADAGMWEASGRVAVTTRWTIGGSADDGGVGDLDSRRVFAVNPDEWPGDLCTWYADYYPGIELVSIRVDSAIELYYELLLEAQGPVSEAAHVWMRDPRWAGHNLGGPTGEETIGTDGCVVSVLSTMLRERLGYDVRPDELNDALNEAGVFYNEDLIDWALFAWQFSAVHWIGRQNRAFSAAKVQALLDEPDAAVIVVVAGGTHFCYLTAIDGHTLEVDDPLYPGAPHHRDISEVSGVRLFTVDARGSETEPAPQARSIRGVHGAPVTFAPTDQDYWIGELTAMGVRWYKDMSCDVDWCRRLLDAGIEPVVRLYQAEQFPGRLYQDRLDVARRLCEAGITYFEIGNEPNLPHEWCAEYREQLDWHNANLVDHLASNWWRDAQEILAIGGKLALYAMAPTERGGGTNERYSSIEWLQRYLAAVRALAPAQITGHVEAGRIWLAVHVSPFERPCGYDPYSAGEHPDDMCLRAFEVYREIAAEALGTTPTMIGTEGGLYSPEHLRALGWAAYSEADWTRRMPEMYAYVVEHYPYVLAICPWILTDEGVADSRWRDNGWYHGREARPVAVALRGAG